MKIFIIGSLDAQHSARQQFEFLSLSLGRQLAQHPVTVMMCSPYPDSCDFNVLRGIQQAVPNSQFCLELHYPRINTVEASWQDQLAVLGNRIRILKFGHEALAADDHTATKYSWLLSQLRAIEEAHYIILMGGRIGGSSDLLVRLADSQRKLLLPLPLFDGVGAACFAHKRYQLRDTWGDKACQLLEREITSQQLVEMLIEHRSRQTAVPLLGNIEPVSFFISYPWERPVEADLVEMILRRRNYDVLRDEQSFAPGEHIPQAIEERIRQSTVFIALWCREYACSPWCYDELSLALQTHLTAGKSLWIFNLDATRMVHPQARERLLIPAASRRDLIAELIRLLQLLQH